MKAFRRIIFITLGTFSAILLFLHLLLAFKAKELLQKAVDKASNGKYRLEAKDVTFQYIHPGIKAEAVQLVPNTKGERQGSASFGKIDIELASLLHLVFQKKIEVNHILFSDVKVEAYAKNQSGVEKKGIAEATKEVQDKLLAAIESLNIKNLSILNAGVTIHTADTTKTEYLAFNHLDLVFKNIMLEKQGPKGKPVFNIDGYLHLRQPEIHLPGTSNQLNIGSLKASIADSSLTIDSLSIIAGLDKPHPQKVSLAELDIDGFHWNHYLATGILEFDSLVAKQGRAEINLTNPKKDETQTTDTVHRKYMGSSFIIHHSLISNVSYHVTSIAKRGKTKGAPVSMDLDGDSLVLKDVSIIHGRSPVADVAQLEIAIKDFKLSDSMQKRQITMGGFAINNKNLVIKNYLLETDKSDKTNNYFRIAIPHFQLHDFSLEELLQKELSASKMELNSPEIMVDIRQIKSKDSTSTKPNSNINNSITAITESVSKKVKLGEIAIRDGNFVLLPTLDPKDQVKLTGLSMVIDATQLPKINGAMDIVHAIKTLNSTGFSVVGKNISLHVKDMRLESNPRGLYFGSIKGEFGEGRMVDLKGVTILNTNKDFDPTREEGLHVSDFLVDSGTIAVEINPNATPKKQSTGVMPTVKIDNLDFNKIVLRMRKDGKVGISAALDVAATDLAFKDGKAYWAKLDISAVHPGANIEKTSFDAASMTVLQPGLVRIQHPQGKTSINSGMVDFSAESMTIGIGIQSSAITRLKIESLQLQKPVLKIALQKNPAVANVKTPGPEKKQMDVVFDQLELIEPTFDFELLDSAGTKIHKHQAYTGTLRLQQLKTLDDYGKPMISARHISYHTDVLKAEFKGKSINPSSLGFEASNFSFIPDKKLLRIHIDSAYANNVSQNIIGKKQDTIYLYVGQTNVLNFTFDSRDSLDWHKLIHSVSWRTSGINIAYHTPKQIIKAWQLQANNNKLISLSLDSFAIINRLSRAEAWAATPYEKGYETIKGGRIAGKGINVVFNDNKPAVSIKKFDTYHLQFTTGKDKTKLEDTINYRPLLTQTLMKIPLDLFIDSLMLDNARVEANEISKKTGKETSIFFTEVNGYLQNVKTRNVQPGDTLDMRIRARFYGTDVVRLHFRQSYYDTLQEFWMRVRMSHFEMPEMNKMLVPLMGLKIHSGTVDSLLLITRGNDYFAYGTMDMRYHHLKAKLLKTEDTKGKWLVSIANFFTGVFLRKHDNGRTDLLFKERIRKRSIFNFWGKIALEGLLTNLGIKRDKAERKQFEKTVKEFDLSENYWQDDND